MFDGAEERLISTPEVLFVTSQRGGVVGGSEVNKFNQKKESKFKLFWKVYIKGSV